MGLPGSVIQGIGGVRKHKRKPFQNSGSLNTQDFVRDFIHQGKGRYVDLGNHDCASSEGVIYIRNKIENRVDEFGKKKLRIDYRERMNPLYYLASASLMVMAFYFAALFMGDSLRGDIWLLVLAVLFISPFVIRRFISGFQVIGIYFTICILFSVTVGSWQENELGSGVLIFFVVGLSPYVASRLFARIWREAYVELSGNGSLSFTCPQEKLGALLRLVGNDASYDRFSSRS